MPEKKKAAEKKAPAAKAPAAEERKRICREMSGAILALARALPEHRVVPYRNVSKREYPSSRKGAEA